MESNWSHEPTVDGTLARTVSPMRSTLALQTRSWTPTTTQTFSVPCSLTEPWLESFLAVTARHRRPSPAGPEPLSCCFSLAEKRRCQTAVCVRWHVTLTPLTHQPRYTPLTACISTRSHTYLLIFNSVVFVSAAAERRDSKTHFRHMHTSSHFTRKAFTSLDHPNFFPLTEEFIRNRYFYIAYIVWSTFSTFIAHFLWCLIHNVLSSNVLHLFL